MWPVARGVAATVVVVATAGYYQIFALKSARDEFRRVVPFSALIATTQAGVARSKHPELYRPGARFGYLLVGETDSNARTTSLLAFRYALAPAEVVPDPDAERVIVFFTSPAEVAKFEVANPVRLLDTLDDCVRVYQRERN